MNTLSTDGNKNVVDFFAGVHLLGYPPGAGGRCLDGIPAKAGTPAHCIFLQERGWGVDKFLLRGFYFICFNKRDLSFVQWLLKSFPG